MKNKSIAQLLTGVLILALGVGFLLDSLNVFDFGHYLKYLWPLAIVAVGVVSLINNPRVFIWPLAIIGFGVVLLLQRLEIINFSVWQVIWPAAIIVFGLSLIFERSGLGIGRPKDVDDDKLNMFVAFSGQNTRSVSQQFKGGTATAIFGGIDLDLRDAKIKDQATLEVFTAFGGADIKVPEGWVVKVSGLPLFGGWENKTRRPTNLEGAPVLNIRATCLFGGIDIKD